MPYLASGAQVDAPRSFFEPVSRFLWGIVNVVVLFVQTMAEPFFGNNNQSSDYRLSGRGPNPFGPGGGPRRRMGGFRGGPGAPSPPPMASGG